MASKETQTEKSFPFNLAPMEFAVMGKKQIEEFTSVQSELFEKFEATRREWLDRVQSEANMASEFASKLSAVRSIPEAMTIYGDWANRWFEMMADDRKHLLEDYQKFAETGARLMANGGQSKSSAVAS
jgi:Phasin protein